jgi:general stress protein 26
MSKEEEVVPTREESISKLAELVKEVRIAMLTTIGTDGKLHSRPMATQETPFAGEVLFLTGADSGKMEDIRQDQEVNLSYCGAKHVYVTMTGRAVISNDRALIAALWSPMYKAWFPEGATDPSIRVLRVKIDEAEYWSASSSSIVRNLEILARAATGGKTPVGDHARITL